MVITILPKPSRSRALLYGTTTHKHSPARGKSPHVSSTNTSAATGTLNWMCWSNDRQLRKSQNWLLPINITSRISIESFFYLFCFSKICCQTQWRIFCHFILKVQDLNFRYLPNAFQIVAKVSNLSRVNHRRVKFRKRFVFQKQNKCVQLCGNAFACRTVQLLQMFSLVLCAH